MPDLQKERRYLPFKHFRNGLLELVKLKIVELLGKHRPTRCLAVDPIDNPVHDPDRIILCLNRDQITPNFRVPAPATA